MPTYDYECQECESVYELIQSMKDDRFETHECPVCNKETSCSRLISGGSGPPIWKTGDSKRQINKNRGYGGRFGSKIRTPGTPVDAPANKHEADKQFQTWVDSGGLDGIKPSMDMNGKPGSPQTTEQLLDKKYKPKGD